MIKILLLGSGGREHAIAWKLSQSPLCSKLFIAPGNAGTSQSGTNVNLKSNDFEAIHGFCVKEDIDMVFVGPEEPLVNGISDFLRNKDNQKKIIVIGPSMQGAQLEGSKAFAKRFMKRHDIPTAAYEEFANDSYIEGVRFIQQHALPIVLKADGLAAGKGVLICKNHVEAVAEFELMVQKSKFGEAGKTVVVEEFLTGIELSVFVFTDGRHYVILPEAKDYKRIGEGDTGLNTGGMGAVSPVAFADSAFMKKVEDRVIKPTIHGLQQEQIDYQGIIFIGLIKVNDDPYVIEYNCRLGDPETEVVIPRLKNDLVEICLAASRQELNTVKIETDERAAATIVAVSGGYPGHFEKGFEIQGLPATTNGDTMVFHAATRKAEELVITNGGRVLCVTSFGDNIQQAASRSREVLQKIYFENIYYRNDIGYEFE
jgi:phosphoribosylamine---glycine ligase